ncbi:hypothetical protein [Mesorhizobium sp. CO1-1-2]|uniref:hypothetical protein n=1 Tax=unclassified Mesorhizobium TaxID=325217 RepID=UPI00398D0FB3
MIAILLISHDMAVVERIAHRVAVIYPGEIVEIGDRRSVFGNPQRPVGEPMSDEIPSAMRDADFVPVRLPMNAVRQAFRSGDGARLVEGDRKVTDTRGSIARMRDGKSRSGSIRTRR